MVVIVLGLRDMLQIDIMTLLIMKTWHHEKVEQKGSLSRKYQIHKRCE